MPRAPRALVVGGAIGGVTAACAFSVALSGCTAGLPYHGPPSDHFDGETFRNLGPFEEQGFGALLKWKTTGPSAVRWPDFVEVAPSPPPPSRVTDGIRITFVNHATVLIQLGGVNILTDPVWSDFVGPTSVLGQKRHKPPGLPFEKLPPIDVVLISHNHYDHLDLPTLRRLHDRDAPLVLAGLGTAALLVRHGISRARDLDWWQAEEVRGAHITFAPAQHWSRRSALDSKRNLWGSYFITVGARSVYFAGDTGPGPHFQMIRDRLGAPELALLPIGAYLPRWFMNSQHVDPEGAVVAHLTLGAKQSVAIHWGTLQQADEGMDDPPAELRRALARRGVPSERFVVLDNGQGLAVE